MVKKREALDILKKEYNYEESLMEDLSITFLSSLKDIDDLNEDECKELNFQLTIIRDDTDRHKKIFQNLINSIQEDESDNF